MLEMVASTVKRIRVIHFLNFATYKKRQYDETNSFSYSHGTIAFFSIICPEENIQRQVNAKVEA